MQARSGGQWLLAVSSEGLDRKNDHALALTYRRKGTLNAELQDVASIQAAPHMLWPALPARRLVDLKPVQDNKNTDDDDSLPGSGRLSHRAVQQVLAACDGLESATFGQDPSVTIFIPVIVTGAQLWTVELARDGEPIPKQVDHALITGRLRSDQAVDSVWVVHERYVREFAARGAAGASRLSLSPIADDERARRSVAAGP